MLLRNLGRAAGVLLLITGLASGTRGNPWTHAILPLEIPLTRGHGHKRVHFTEHCTGTLLEAPVPTILTAWHCFDGDLDLAEPARVLMDGSWYGVRLVATGGDMSKDWALLQFGTDLPPNLPAALPASTEVPLVGAQLSLAGFGVDRALGDSRRAMQPRVRDCRVLDADSSGISAVCVASKGDSGGPVVIGTSQGKQVVGILSGRHPSGYAVFVPVSRLGTALPKTRTQAAAAADPD